jgi:hypothetical protein
MDNSTTASNAATTTTATTCTDFYGYLQHPSGVRLPKLVRQHIQRSFEKGSSSEDFLGGTRNHDTVAQEEEEDDDDNEDDESDYDKLIISRSGISRERYWTVTEITDMINRTSQQIENVQSQILNGEDYYNNHVASISVYNTKNNHSDSTTFLDSKMDANFINQYNNNNNISGGTTGHDYGMNSNSNNNSNNSTQNRWFSNSFTDLSPYQQVMSYPTVVPTKQQKFTTHPEPSASLRTTHHNNNNNTTKATTKNHPPTATTTTRNQQSQPTIEGNGAREITDRTTPGSTGSRKRGSSTSGSTIVFDGSEPLPTTARRTTKRRRKT